MSKPIVCARIEEGKREIPRTFDPHLAPSIFDDPKVPRHIKHLLTCLGRHCGPGVAVCWPSLDYVARATGWSPGNLRRNIATAERLGLIVRLQGARRWVFVLLWKLKGCAPARGDEAPARTHPDRRRAQEGMSEKREKRTGVGGRAAQWPPPPPDPNVERAVAAAAAVHAAVQQGQAAPLAAEERAEMARTVLAGGPLAGCYRAALATEGIVGDEAIRALAGVSPALPPPAPKNPERGVTASRTGTVSTEQFKPPAHLADLSHCQELQTDPRLTPPKGVETAPDPGPDGRGSSGGSDPLRVTCHAGTKPRGRPGASRFRHQGAIESWR